MIPAHSFKGDAKYCMQCAYSKEEYLHVPQSEAGKLADRARQEMRDYDAFVKHDQDKSDWSLVPWSSMRQVLTVLEIGAKKYSADNWQKGTEDRYKKALLRHVLAYAEGEKLDQETGLHHLAHAACNCLFILWFK